MCGRETFPDQATACTELISTMAAFFAAHLSGHKRVCRQLPGGDDLSTCGGGEAPPETECVTTSERFQPPDVLVRSEFYVWEKERQARWLAFLLDGKRGGYPGYFSIA